jgi:hypothetical protein
MQNEIHTTSDVLCGAVRWGYTPNLQCHRGGTPMSSSPLADWILIFNLPHNGALWDS